MTWEEHVNIIPPDPVLKDLKETEIECPNCGENIYKRLNKTYFRSNVDPLAPERQVAFYRYECLNEGCGWIGYART